MHDLDDKTHALVTRSVPIVCTDMVFIREVNSKTELGMIMRETGSQKGKYTVLGGRIKHSESIGEAIDRHIETDLRVTR